jgi:hypothetical protein
LRIAVKAIRKGEKRRIAFNDAAAKNEKQKVHTSSYL